METDIILDPPPPGRRLVIDTKFASIFLNRRFGGDSLKSGYLYQMYAYLRSQEGSGDLSWDRAAGLLLHPTIDTSVFEWGVIQKHPISFATIDLRRSPTMIRNELRSRLLGQVAGDPR
jgi:5-methylcytosine-specific restriction enzyme subunit McrC